MDFNEFLKQYITHQNRNKELSDMTGEYKNPAKINWWGINPDTARGARFKDTGSNDALGGAAAMYFKNPVAGQPFNVEVTPIANDDSNVIYHELAHDEERYLNEDQRKRLYVSSINEYKKISNVLGFGVNDNRGYRGMSYGWSDWPHEVFANGLSMYRTGNPRFNSLPKAIQDIVKEYGLNANYGIDYKNYQRK